MQELANIDWDKTLSHLIDFATSSEGKDILKKTLPLTKEEDALRSFKIISEAQGILLKGQRPYMESLDLYHSWFHRLEKNAVLKTLELKDVRFFLLEVDHLKETLAPLKSPWIDGLKPKIMSAEEPLSAIDHLMTPSGDIRTDASETLFKLYQEKKQIANKVQNTLDELVKGHDHDPHLQDKYVTNREGRWVIPVKSGMRHELEGIIHGMSTSKQTVYMEPQEIVPLNNRIKQLEVDIEKEIAKLLKDISDYLYSLTRDFVRSKSIMVEVDCYLSKAQFANVTSACAITFNNKEIRLEDLKHPVMVLNGENVIPNSLKLTQEEKILILSGPNAGGKTVLLKAFGLAAHMARCGLLICASPNSHLPFFDDIFVAVGDTQSVDQNLSTFAGHLKVLDQACHTQGTGSLILIDEICGSTDPDEGAALARGFIHHYAEQGSFALITSHLGPLKSGWDKESRIVNGSMNYDTESGRATYEFIRGIPGRSLAFATAKKIGIMDSVYNRAKIFLSPAGQKRIQSLDEIEKVKEEISRLKKSLKSELNETKKKQDEFDKLIAVFNREKEEKLKKEVSEALEKIKEELKKGQVKNLFESNERRQQISVDFPEVVKYSQPTAGSEKNFESLQSFAKAFPAGSVVFVTSLNQDGIIQGEANSKGEIPVLSGSMRLYVDWQLLKPPKKTQNPLKIKNNQKTTEVVYDAKKDEVDLRGLTLNDAIEKLEVTLDNAQANQMERVKIIHGHGSDTLKKAVRSHLSRSVYVSRWMASGPNDGGDGVTMAFLMGE